MDKRRSRFVPGEDLAQEVLERREVLSALGASGAAQVAAHAGGTATRTTLKVSAGTLAQPITLTATVRAASHAASAPSGTVQILDQGQLIDTITLSPSAGARGRSAVSTATNTLVSTPGGPALYFGKHQLTAVFVPDGAFSPSRATRSFNVHKPAYTQIGGGVKVATVAPGSGPAIQAGQTANMLYTGYLAKGGSIFDESSLHGGTPFSFTVGAGQVVPGFDAGTVGMKVGETRIISIPPSQGYGSTTVGSIPANSTLIFVVTLQSIS